MKHGPKKGSLRKLFFNILSKPGKENRNLNERRLVWVK